MATKTEARTNGSAPPMLGSNMIINERGAREGSTSVFENYRNLHFKHRYAITLHLSDIAGGIPFNPKVMEGWLKTKISIDPDIDTLQELVSATLAEVQGEDASSLDPDEIRNTAIASLSEQKVNGFKRLRDQTLVIEGRQLKAMIIEAGNSIWPKARWGKSGKGTINYFKEHLFIPEDAIPLMTPLGERVKESDEIRTRFVKGHMGVRAITREEVCRDVTVEFTLKTDHDFTAKNEDGELKMPEDDFFGHLWVHAEDAIGLGAARTTTAGRFYVTKFEKL